MSSTTAWMTSGTGLRAVEPGDDPVERLERVEPFAPLGREPLRALLRLVATRRTPAIPAEAMRIDDRLATTNSSVGLAPDADPLGVLPVGDQDRRSTATDHHRRGDRDSPGVSAA